MEIQIASDLHIEFFDDNDWDSKGLIVPNCEVLALLGDIGVATSPKSLVQYESFLTWCCGKFAHVLVLTGNHEYYNHGSSITIEEVDATIERLEKTLPQLIFMNKRSVLIGGVRILGTTLWSAIPNTDAAKEVEGFLNDYRLIYQQGAPPHHRKKRLKATASHQMHEDQLQWLTMSLQEAAEQEPAVPVVILTHHTPSMTGTSDPAYEGAPLPVGYRNCGFSSPLDHLITAFPGIRCWCYGHTHFNNHQVRDNGTLLVSNQRGYEGSVSRKFKPDFVLYVDLDTGQVHTNSVSMIAPPDQHVFVSVDQMETSV